MLWTPEKSEERATISVSDPFFMEFFNPGFNNYSGVSMSEQVALSVPAVWRAVSGISQVVASLDVSAVVDDGVQVDEVGSWVSDPGAVDGITKFEFWEMLLVHLLIHGNAYLLHRYNAAGAVIGLFPVHPSHCSVELDLDTRQRVFRVQDAFGHTTPYSDEDLTHVKGMSSDWLRGYAPISVARTSWGAAVASERASAGIFDRGPMQVGLVTPTEDLDPGEAEQIKTELQRKIGGYENSGSLAVVNRKLEFKPWSLSMKDAEWIDSKKHQIEDIARWFGYPPHMLMQTDKQTSWGSGVAEQARGLGRTVIGPWTDRLKWAFDRLLPPSQRLRFDFSAYERPNPSEEVAIVSSKVSSGLITVNEGRRELGYPPVEGGDVLHSPAGTPGSTSTDEEPEEGPDEPEVEEEDEDDEDDE